MTDIKPLEIPINSIERDFEDFLSPESNTRIIFSGPFGIGKTYFLNKFFAGREQNYLPIFLRPVNYSLLSNEDIFKLIKYDILLQLIHKDGFMIDREFVFSKFDYSSFFISENKFLILQNLLKLIPKIQGTIDGIENFSKLIDAYKIGKQRINENTDLELLFGFQNEANSNFLLEYDNVSQLIANKLNEIAGTGESKERFKKILIVDDLDRLDPEHIFRLFNVFSAHFDHVNYYPNGTEIKDNKFGFDKVIFVCDIENIRKIFAHKYGDGVDFCGYIDKFYSSQIYHFNNDDIILKYVNEIFRPYENENPQRGGSQSSILSIVKLIFRDLVDSKCINHRIIENIIQKKIRFRDPYTINFWGQANVRNHELIFIQVLDFLYDIFGKNYKTLHEAIKKASELKKTSANSSINNHIIHLLPLLSLNDLRENAQYTWRHLQNSNSISYQIDQGMNGLYYANIKSPETSWMNYQNYYSLLLLVIENLKNIGVFE